MSFLTSPVMSFLYPPPLTDLLASTPAEKTCSADFTRPPAAFPPTPQLRKEGRKEGAVAAFLPLLPHSAPQLRSWLFLSMYKKGMIRNMTFRAVVNLSRLARCLHILKGRLNVSWRERFSPVSLAGKTLPQSKLFQRLSGNGRVYSDGGRVLFGR